ncbi:MAG: HEAT repeat domain-containing protein [Lentisphaerae bacterium]|jgi:hypothetical protein|nr:HEAT repeat domain-containing protein [Lentisphaerota bacterium]
MTITALLTTAAIFFPLWMPIWQERPLQNKDLEYESPTCMTVETYEMVLGCLPTADARLREQIYTQLASKPVPANQEVLLHCLRREPETRQQGAILRLLRRTDPATIPPADIAAFLQKEPTQLAEAAIQLYATLPTADLEQLRPFLGKPTGNTMPLILRRRAWEAMAASPRLADALGPDVFPFRDADDILFQTLALQTALTQTSRRAQTDSWIDAALDGDIQLRLAVARDPQPTRTDVMRRILQDDSPAVRIAFCLANRGTAQEMLVLALDDRDDAIRTEAVRALARCSSLESKTLPRLADCLSDPSEPVREEAETALLQHARQQQRDEVLAELTARLSSPKTVTTLRYHACRLFAALRHTAAAPTIAAILESERAPATIGAALDALAVLAQRDSYGELILPYADHRSALVRQAAANALGRLRITGSEKALKTLSLDQHSPAVRTTAFAAMGYFPQPAFAADLLACLKNTTKTTEEERTSAAWAAGKIKPSTPAETAAMVTLAKRLVEQVTLPVVPSEMEPVFDGPAVIANAIYSITVMGSSIESAEIREMADIVLNIYDVPAEQLESLAMSRVDQPAAQEIPRSPTTCSLANQARQWQKNETITTQAVPTGSIYFPVRTVRK